MPLTRVTDGSSGTLQIYDLLAVHSVQVLHILKLMLFQRIILFHLNFMTHEGNPRSLQEFAPHWRVKNC